MRHWNSIHPSEQRQSSRSIPEPMQVVSGKKVKELISDISQHLANEKLCKQEYIAETYCIFNAHWKVYFNPCKDQKIL